MEKADLARLNSEQYALRVIPENKLTISKEKLQEWKAKFGFRPTTIWHIGHKGNFGQNKKLEKIFGNTVASNSYLTGDMGKGYVLQPKKKSLSQFPLELARRIVLFWSSRNDKVFDPFSGMGERMQITAYLGRHYYGQDISRKFNKQKKALINKQTLCPYPGMRKDLLADSRKIDYPDNFFDFSFTSPPYWNIEDYGDEPEQLGNNDSYNDFMKEIGKVISENIRVVKPNKYIVWVVADIRKNNKLISYHSDIISMFEFYGAILHDIVIYNVGELAAAFISNIQKYKRMGKTHEYILVFKKTVVQKERGEKSEC